MLSYRDNADRFTLATMSEAMQQQFGLIQRPWGVYYCEDLVTKKQETLRTRDRDEAFRLVAAKNENEEAPTFSIHLARVYWKAGDPAGASRTWQHVMDEIPKLKQDETRHRWLTAIKDKALDSIRELVVLQTRADHWILVLPDAVEPLVHVYADGTDLQQTSADLNESTQLVRYLQQA